MHILWRKRSPRSRRTRVAHSDNHEADAAALTSERERRAVRIGVLGVVVAFSAIGILQAYTVPPFFPLDEAAHTGYALVLADGELPDIDTPIPSERVPGLPRLDVWTANHPPLFYAIEAIPLRIGVAMERPLGGFRAARLLSVALAALALAATAWLARALVPSRPEVAVLAPGMLALLGSFGHISAFVHNDSLSVLTATLTLAAAVNVLRDGPSARSLTFLAAAASSAALTRASGVAVAALAVAAAMLAGWWDDRAPTRVSRIMRAVSAASPVGVAVALSAGWFYLRNRSLYGDATGTTALLEKFGRNEPGVTPLEVVTSASFWRDQYDQLWGRWARGMYLSDSAQVAARLLVVTAAVAVIWFLARSVRRFSMRGRAPEVASWLLAVAYPLALVMLTAGFVSRGGSAHARYLFPGLGVVAIGVASLMTHLPGRRFALPALAFLTVEAGVLAAVWSNFLTRLASDGTSGLPAARRALTGAGVDAPVAMLVLLVGLFLGGCAAQARSLWVLHREP